MVTPSSFSTASLYSTSRPSKPPIHNPFDKFTQSEFDAFISDITGALRRALGEEPTPTHTVLTTPGRDSDTEPSPDRLDRGYDLEHSAESASDVGSEASQDVEDSFADVRARHAKGKARDPREGPGLGSQQHPIDIESEEEEDEEEEEDAEERVVEELEGYEELEEEEYEQDEQEILPYADGRDEEEDQDSDGQEYEEDVLEGDGDGEGSDIIETPSKPTHADHVEEVIDLVSDDEPDDEGAISGEEEPHTLTHAPNDDHFENLFSGDGQDDYDFPTSFDDSFLQPPDIRDPWEGPKTYAEDFYAGGDLRDRDLKSERPSPSNLTPVRQEKVETLRTFIPDSPPSDGDPPDYVPGLYHELDTVRHQLYGDPTDQDVDWTLSHDEQDDNDEELQSDAFQVSDAAFEDEQQSVIDVDGDDSVERIDLTDLEEPTTQHVESYDMDTQEDFFGSISVDAENKGDESLEPQSINSLVNIAGTDSPADFGILPDILPDGVSAQQLDMTEVLSFLAYDKDEEGAIPSFDRLDDLDGGRMVDDNHEQPEIEALQADDEIIPKDHADQMVEEIVVNDNPPEELRLVSNTPQIQSLDASANSGDFSALPTSADSAQAATPPPITDKEEEITRSAATPPPLHPTVVPIVPLTPSITQSTRQSFSPRAIWNGVPMPVSADPNVPDPTDRSPSVTDLSVRSVRPPMVLSLPGTPPILLSPVGTPGMPTPVSMPVPRSVLGNAVLRAVQLQHRLSTQTTSGLFTPAPGDGSETASGPPSKQSSRTDTPDLGADSAAGQDYASSVPTEGSSDDEEMTQPSPGMDNAVDNEVEPVALVTLDDDEKMAEPLEGPPAIDGVANKEGEVSLMPPEVTLDYQKTADLVEEPPAVIEIVDDEGELVASVPTEVSSGEEEAAAAAPPEGYVNYDTPNNGSEDMDISDSAAGDLEIEPLTQEKFVTNDDQMPVSHPSPRGEGTPAVQHAVSYPIMIQPALSVVYRSEPTTPILHSDPYPYCLSTPGASLPVLEEDSQDEDTESLSEEENDRSSCSSTKNEMEAEEGDQILPIDVDGSEFELLYPSEEADEECEGRGVPGIVEDQQVSHAQQSIEEDVDAVLSSQHQTADDNDQVKIVTDQGTNGGLFKVAPINEGPSQAETIDAVMSPVREPSPTEAFRNDNEIPATTIQSSVSLGPSEDLEPPRPLKRQRQSPPTPETRPSPTMVDAEVSDTANHKGKGKAVTRGLEDVESVIEIESSSGASTAERMLLPGSESSSRASSVLSFTPSDTFTSSKPGSPSTTRSSGAQYDNLAHLFHTHGVTRQQHHPQPPARPVLPPNRAKQPTPPRTKHPQTDLLSRSESAVSNRSLPNPNSPVTRSHCRFHKISLPLQEGGPRVYFLVPGCSLVDRSLMRSQHITDHGPAEHEDGRRVIRDLDMLDFSSYFIGVLRQLVGVDLLREQEIFYLPQPGEDHRRKTRRKSAVTRLSFRDSSAASPPQVKRSPQYSPLSPSIASPPSSKASTTADMRLGFTSEAPSPSAASSPPDANDHDYSTPIRKITRSYRDLVGSSAAEVTPVASSSKRKMSPPLSRESNVTRRSKRLELGALAHKPLAGGEKDSSADEEPRGRRSKLKRARTSEAPLHQDEPDRKKKLPRVHLTFSAAAAGST